MTAALLNPAPADQFEAGVLYDFPAESYHQVEAMSASGASKILRSPAHFRVWREQKKEPTPQMIFGTALHLAVLEPDRLDTAVVVSPDFNRRTKDGRAAAEAFESEAAKAGRIVLDRERFDCCLRARDAVAAHAGAQSLLAGTRKEVSLFWRDRKFDVPCKARLDALRPDGGIVDVKTTDDASPEAFGRSIAAWMYHAQGAHYCMGAEDRLNRTPPFFALIAVERDEPFGCACYVLDSSHLLAGSRLINEALDRYAKALASQSWPAYDQTIQPARLPKWALQFSA